MFVFEIVSPSFAWHMMKIFKKVIEIQVKMLSPMTITRVGFPNNQDNKTAGSVTHVMVNDPTGCYGIFIETMPENAESLSVE